MRLMATRHRIAIVIGCVVLLGAAAAGAFLHWPWDDVGPRGSAVDAAAIAQTPAPPARATKQLPMPESVAAAMRRGGDAYWQGDFSAAVDAFRTLAEDPAVADRYRGEAFYRLAVLYEYGLGNRRIAFGHYREAAELGQGRAQIRLGAAYSIGVDIPLDYVRALMWASIATRFVTTEHDRLVAVGNRETLEELMPVGDAVHAEDLARDWLANFRKRRKTGG